MQKIPTHVVFPLEGLDLAPFVTGSILRERTGVDHPVATSGGSLEAAFPSGPLPYDLAGVVVHQGNMDGGHYTAFLQSEGRWFKADDAKITPATPEVVQQCQAYMLLYTYRPGPPPTGTNL